MTVDVSLSCGLGSLSGAHALITGAAGGIGQAIAWMLHQHGAHVHISGRNVGGLESVAEKLGDRVSIWPMDLSDAESIKTCVSGITAANIPLNILINNAGITKDALLMKMPDEDWMAVIQTNLTSCFHLCKMLFPMLSKPAQGYGRIINISSVVGCSGNAGQANYVASKAGLIGLTKALALECGKRPLTVNAIAPGFIETPMTDVLKDTYRADLLHKIPCKRMGRPEEVAFAALFLADARASYITGETIHVNGGLGMF